MAERLNPLQQILALQRAQTLPAAQAGGILASGVDWARSNPKEAAQLGVLMSPDPIAGTMAGVAEAFGRYPDPFNPGQNLPSVVQQLREGEYLGAGLTSLGALPVIGAAGPLLRATRGSNEGILSITDGFDGAGGGGNPLGDLSVPETITSWVVSPNKTGRENVVNRLARDPSVKARSLSALDDMGYGDTVPVFRMLNTKSETLQGEQLISGTVKPEQLAANTDFMTQGKIDPFTEGGTDFILVRYDVPRDKVQAYLPAFKGDIEKGVNKKVKERGFGQDEIPGVEKVEDPSGHAKKLLDLQDEILVDVTDLEPTVLLNSSGQPVNPLDKSLWSQVAGGQAKTAEEFSAQMSPNQFVLDPTAAIRGDVSKADFETAEAAARVQEFEALNNFFRPSLGNRLPPEVVEYRALAARLNASKGADEEAKALLDTQRMQDAKKLSRDIDKAAKEARIAAQVADTPIKSNEQVFDDASGDSPLDTQLINVGTRGVDSHIVGDVQSDGVAVTPVRVADPVSVALSDLSFTKPQTGSKVLSELKKHPYMSDVRLEQSGILDILKDNADKAIFDNAALSDLLDISKQNAPVRGSTIRSSNVHGQMQFLTPDATRDGTHSFRFVDDPINTIHGARYKESLNEQGQSQGIGLTNHGGLSNSATGMGHSRGQFAVITDSQGNSRVGYIDMEDQSDQAEALFEARRESGGNTAASKARLKKRNQERLQNHILGFRDTINSTNFDNFLPASTRSYIKDAAQSMDGDQAESVLTQTLVLMGDSIASGESQPFQEFLDMKRSFMELPANPETDPDIIRSFINSPYGDREMNKALGFVVERSVTPDVGTSPDDMTAMMWNLRTQDSVGSMTDLISVMKQDNPYSSEIRLFREELEPLQEAVSQAAAIRPASEKIITRDAARMRPAFAPVIQQRKEAAIAKAQSENAVANITMRLDHANSLIEPLKRLTEIGPAARSRILGLATDVANDLNVPQEVRVFFLDNGDFVKLFDPNKFTGVLDGTQFRNSEEVFGKDMDIYRFLSADFQSNPKLQELQTTVRSITGLTPDSPQFPNIQLHNDLITQMRVDNTALLEADRALDAAAEAAGLQRSDVLDMDSSNYRYMDAPVVSHSDYTAQFKQTDLANMVTDHSVDFLFDSDTLELPSIDEMLGATDDPRKMFPTLFVNPSAQKLAATRNKDVDATLFNAYDKGAARAAQLVIRNNPDKFRLVDDMKLKSGERGDNPDLAIELTPEYTETLVRRLHQAYENAGGKRVATADKVKAEYKRLLFEEENPIRLEMARGGLVDKQALEMV